MMNGSTKSWRRCKIGDLCRLVNGRAFKPSEWNREGLPIIRIQNLNDATKPYNRFSGTYDHKHLVKPGDVLLSWSGTPGTSFGCFIWNRENGVLNQHIFKVEVDREYCTPEYFVCAVNNALGEMIEQSHGGVGLRHITKEKLEQIELPIAPLCDQHGIVERARQCLSRLDEISVLQRHIQKEAGLLFSRTLNDFVSPEWPVTKLDDVATDISNGWSGKQDERGLPVGVLRLSCVHELVVDESDTRQSTLAPESVSKFSIKRGDVFVVRGNGSKHLVGRSAICVADRPAVVFNDLLIRLRFNAQMLPAFANLMLHCPQWRRQIESLAKTAAGIWKINQTNLGLVEVPCPTIRVQQSVVERLQEAKQTHLGLVRELASFDPARLRKAIFQSAFEGEL